MSAIPGKTAPVLENLTAENLTQHVIDISTENAPNGRSKDLISGLIKHVHDYVREARITPAEWELGWKFLTDVRKSKLHAMVLNNPLLTLVRRVRSD
jgi:hypothetical protein